MNWVELEAVFEIYDVYMTIDYARIFLKFFGSVSSVRYHHSYDEGRIS